MKTKGTYTERVYVCDACNDYPCTLITPFPGINRTVIPKVCPYDPNQEQQTNWREVEQEQEPEE